MAEQTWSSLEQPILEAAVAAVQQGRDPSEAIAQLDVGGDDRGRAIVALIDARYLTGQVMKTFGGTTAYVDGVTERARRATGQWPSESVYADLLSVLEARIDTTTDPERKGKLRALIDALRSVGQDVATDVIAKVIEHQTGM